MTATRQQASDHYYDPSTHHDVQDFQQWVKNKSCPGITFTSAGPRHATFVPDSDVNKYFDCHQAGSLAQVRRLVAAATNGSSTPVNARTVAQKCPKVFAILVLIGQARYVNSFVKNDNLRNLRLPFGPQVHNLFPQLPNGVSFFQRFYDEQWQFCAEPLDEILECLDYSDGQILPIKVLKKLDKHQGASAVVHKIVVHPEYDHLPENIPLHQAGRHEYAIKSYHQLEAEKYFYAEVDAFQKLNGSGETVPNLIGFYGAFKQNGSYHVILEYANIGTLEDYFEQVQPPKREADILNLWRSIFQINHALVQIHAPFQGDNNWQSSSDEPRIFQGWHQDIKPNNILVAGDIKTNPYGVRFMLADLGLSHFTAVIQDGAGITGEDTGGSRAYSAPECNLAKGPVSHFTPRIKQCIDTWSLACIYSEVNAWVVDGVQHGVIKYRTERQQEADALGSSLGAAFHDSKGNLLNRVTTWHEDMVHRCAIEDYVTRPLWDELLRYMFVTPGARIIAQQVVAFSDHVMQSAQDKLKRIPTRTQTAPVDLSQSELAPPRTPPNIPPEFQDNHVHSTQYQNHPMTPPYDNNSRSQHISELESNRILSYSPDSLATDKASPELHGHRESLTSVLSENHEPRDYPVSSLEGPFRPVSQAYLNSSAVTITDHERLPRPGNPGSQFPSDSNGYRQHHAASPPGRLPRSSTMPTRAEDAPPFDDPNAKSQALARDLSDVRLDEREQRKGKGRMDVREPSNRNHVTKAAKVLSISQLEHWVELTKSSSQNSFFGSGEVKALPYEAELIGELKKRDHIFVIDDGESMHPHWKSVVALYKNLIYLIKKKKLDPNGSELQFITSDARKEKKNTSELVAMVNEMQYKLQGESNFAARLNKVFDKYIETLRKNRKTRPISLYVFTDGRWQSGNGQIAGVARAIKRMVDFLEENKVMDKQVGVQLIRFGDDGDGKARLKYLDEVLPKAMHLPQDICDTTSADGNVWKMLLGSINSTWDGDSDDDD